MLPSVTLVSRHRVTRLMPTVNQSSSAPSSYTAVPNTTAMLAYLASPMAPKVG